MKLKESKRLLLLPVVRLPCRIVGKYVMEKILRIPVEVDIASEFRYRDPLIDENTLTVIISQSGRRLILLPLYGKPKTEEHGSWQSPT